MAKLTDRQRNNILAKWNTGQYTKTALAKTYKVTEKVIREIVGKEKPTNSDIVEAQLMLENFKKSEKSPNEIQAINQAVEYRLKEKYSKDNKTVRVYDTSFKILDKIDDILKKGTVEEKISKGDGLQQFEPRELNADDALKLAGAVDKISLTTNTNERFSNSQINVNTQNNIDNKSILIDIDKMEDKEVSNAYLDMIKQ